MRESIHTDGRCMRDGGSEVKEAAERGVKRDKKWHICLLFPANPRQHRGKG